MANARKGLAIYFAVLIPVTGIIETVIVRAGPEIRQYGPLLILLLMWTPAVSSFVARLTLREGFADVSFGLGGRRASPGSRPRRTADSFLSWDSR